jgi:hypothetical protein
MGPALCNIRAFGTLANRVQAFALKQLGHEEKIIVCGELDF